MDKKKILVIDYQFCLGGVGIAVANFINNLKDDYDIDLLLIKEGGVLDNRLPSNVNVFYMPEKTTRYFYGSIKQFFKTEKNVFKRIKRLFYSILGKFGLGKTLAIKATKKYLNNFPEYDIVVNNNMDCASRGVCGLCHVSALYGIKSQKKLLFIHGDFVANHYDRNYFKKEYIKYDKILSVSESLNSQMKGLFPEYENKFDALLNFQDVETIKQRAEEYCEVSFDSNVINLISASRLTELKGYIRTLRVVRRLIDEGITNFCWHILGDGEQREEIQGFIKENGLMDFVKLYGVKNNPFPYFKQADMLMLNSYHESYGLVLVESMVVGTTVFATRTICADEIVGNYGWVVDNCEDGIFNGLKTILQSPQMIREKSELLKDYTYDNAGIKDKFKRIVNSL